MIMKNSSNSLFLLEWFNGLICNNYCFIDLKQSVAQIHKYWIVIYYVFGGMHVAWGLHIACSDKDITRAQL